MQLYGDNWLAAVNPNSITYNPWAWFVSNAPPENDFDEPPPPRKMKFKDYVKILKIAATFILPVIIIISTIVYLIRKKKDEPKKDEAS